MSEKTGSVKWYNHSKGYGVIQGDDNCEYFIHYSNLQEGIKSLSRGMKVTFNGGPRLLKKGGMGLEAYELRIVQTPLTKRQTARAANILESAENRSQTFHNAVAQKSPQVDTSHWYSGLKIQKDEPGPVNNPASPEEQTTASGPSHVTSNDCYEKLIPIGSNEAGDKSDGKAYVERVVGVTYEGRQAVVARLVMGERLVLRRELQNVYDRNAIRVERMNGEQVGYINRILAARLAPILDSCKNSVFANVTQLTGGSDLYATRGVVIEFRV